MAKRALQSFTTRVNGKKRVVSRGDVVRDSDKLVKGRESLFENVVEEATAEPGTKQRRRRQGEADQAEDG